MKNEAVGVRRESRARNTDVRKKFIRYKEGAQVYSMCQSTFEKYAKMANAVHKVGKIALVNMEKFERFLDMYAEE